MTTTSRRRLALALVLTTGALLGACATDPTDAPTSRSTMPSGTPTKAGTGETRHDLEPLSTRIPALAQAVEVTWMSGTLGDDDAPGPSLYWIDAVVTLPEGVADGLRESLDLAPAPAAPGVVDGLQEALPDGELLQGAGLDDAFSAEGWELTAYLQAEGDQLVLVVVGE